MVEVIQRIDFDATFSRMKVGDVIEIGLKTERESNIRQKASRYNRKHSVKLVVSAPRGSEVATVIRQL